MFGRVIRRPMSYRSISSITYSGTILADSHRTPWSTPPLIFICSTHSVTSKVCFEPWWLVLGSPALCLSPWSADFPGNLHIKIRPVVSSSGQLQPCTFACVVPCAWIVTSKSGKLLEVYSPCDVSSSSALVWTKDKNEYVFLSHAPDENVMWNCIPSLTVWFSPHLSPGLSRVVGGALSSVSFLFFLGAS